MRKKIGIHITIITVIILLVVINFLASRHYERIDLTEKSIYTLAPATKSILGDLSDVVTIRVYFSFNMPPALLSLCRGVEDVLNEFKSAGGDHLRIEYIDPASSPGDMQRAHIQGIAPVEIGVVEHDRRELTKVYLGMTVMQGDQLQVLPVVQTPANLEYRIAQAILKVSSKEELAVGWLVPKDDNFPVGGGYAGLQRLLEERYAVKKIGLDEGHMLDPKTISTLIVASPGELASDEIAAIDQYIMKGGSLIVLVDRWTISDKLKAKPRATNITTLLAKYGIEVPLDMVMDESSAMAAFSGQMATYHVPYPLWPRVDAKNLSRDDPITAELSSITLPWVSSIDTTGESSERKFDVLAYSSPFAVASRGEQPTIEPEAAEKILRESGEYESYALAVRMKDASSGAEIIVVGSGRFAQDNFLARFPQNVAFIENAVDALAIGERLIGIRSRIGTERPLAMLAQGERTSLKLINVTVGPVLVIVIALIVIAMRRMRRRRVRLAYGKAGVL
jgi:ABC-2 type transport system permease protein